MLYAVIFFSPEDFAALKNAHRGKEENLWDTELCQAFFLSEDVLSKPSSSKIQNLKQRNESAEKQFQNNPSREYTTFLSGTAKHISFGTKNNFPQREKFCKKTYK